MDKVVMIDSSILSLPFTRAYYVPRSNKPLVVTLQVDSLTKKEIIKPVNSAAYWLNIPENYGIGMLVDRDNMKRFGYPVRNYFTANDSTIKRNRFAPIEKGTVNLVLSLPFMNLFDIRTVNKQYNSGGPFAIKGGVEYFYKRNRYLSLDAGAATDVFGEYIGQGYFETGNAISASLMSNIVTGSFDFGYGLHLSRLEWTKNYRDSSKTDESATNIGWGPVLSAQYRFGNYLRMGIGYRPLLIDARSMSFTRYQHYLSIDLSWKFSIR